MRLSARSRMTAALAATWGLLVWLSGKGGFIEDILDRVGRFIGACLGYAHVNDLLWQAYMRSAIIAMLVAAAMPFAAVIVALVRALARSHFRATDTDRLARLRDAIARHPRLTLLISALPGLLTTVASFALWLGAGKGAFLALGVAISGTAALAATGLSALVVRGFLNLMVAPPAEGPPTLAETSADGFTFSAVAVTREARAAVGALAGVSLVAVATVASLPVTALNTPSHQAAIAAYIAMAAGAALLYRRASRIALGLDGVLVTGSSRTRFFAYRDLDGASVSPSREILLQRGGRTILRLQLHSGDVGRRAAIVARVEAGILRAREDSSAQRLAETATASHLKQAARGEGNYRHAAASREELWEVLEAPAADAGARTRAAAALAVGSREEDRKRLRIAAEHCAEPATRAALLRIAEAEEDDEPEPVVPPIKVMSIPRS